MANNRWEQATPNRGKPRVYIQQFFEVKLPEAEYVKIAKSLGLEKPFDEESATRIMEEYLEDLDDGSQCDTVHMERQDGIVNLMTVISYKYNQATYDRLVAEQAVKKMITPSAE